MIFINAASNNNLDIMKTMIGDIDINVSDYDKRNALHLSCANGHYDVVKFLIDSKADINQIDGVIQHFMNSKLIKIKTLSL